MDSLFRVLGGLFLGLLGVILCTMDEYSASATAITGMWLIFSLDDLIKKLK